VLGNIGPQCTRSAQRWLALWPGLTAYDRPTVPCG